METNAETEKVLVVYSIVVWNEHGDKLVEKDTTNTYNGTAGYGVRVNIPEDHTYVTCLLQIKRWDATSRTKG